jgi:hypothetical protein
MQGTVTQQPLRYRNHLDSTILKTEWTNEEDQYLYQLHDEIGNKWAIIAQKLPGRLICCYTEPITT